MIPSRPLRLGEIIQESFRILRKTFTRSSMVMLVAYVPMTILLAIGLNNAVQSGLEIMQKAGIDDHALTVLRDAYRVSTNSTFSARNEAVRDFFANDTTISSQYGTPPLGATSTQSMGWYLRSVARGGLDRGAFGRSILRALAGFIFPLIGFSLFGLVRASLCEALVFDISCQAFEDQPVSLTTNWDAIKRKHAWMLLFMNILIGVIGIAPRAIINLATNSESTIIIVIGAFFVMIAAVAQVFLAIRWSLAPPALISEQLIPFEAMRRSWRLTNGYWWRTCGILIMTAIILMPAMVVVLFVSIIAWVATSYEPLKQVYGAPIMTYSAIEAAIGNIGTWISITFGLLLYLASIWNPAFLTTMYYDLRTRMDGVLDYHEDHEEGAHPTVIELPPLARSGYSPDEPSTEM